VDKVCPRCGERYKWYEAECPACHVTLVDLPEEERPEPDVKLTVVFRSHEPGLVALATVTLGQQEIDYFVRGAAGDSLLAGGKAYRGHSPVDPIEILVRDEDADKARGILQDLAAVPTAAVAPAPHDAASPVEAPPKSVPASIDLIDLDTKQSVGRISEDDLSWLGERLEKESVDDRDYYFDPATIDMLEGEGASADLLALLRRVLGDREGMELRWAPLP
jgi:hypothetical protein